MTGVRKAASRALNGLNMLLGRGRIILTNENEKGGTQFVQHKVSAKETMDTPRLAEYGLASWVPKDGDTIVVFLNGDRTNGVVIATGHQTYRFKLKNEGEVALYDSAGRSIWFKKDGPITVEANNLPIEIDHAKSVTVNSGDDGVTLNTTGNVTLNMGGKDLTISNAGHVVLGPGGKKVVVDGDPVSGGTVHATQSVVTA